MREHKDIYTKFYIIWGYVFVILCLLCTAVMYNLIVPAQLSTKVTRILLFLVCFIGVLANKKINAKTIAFAAFYLVYLLIYIALTQYNINDYLFSFVISYIAICVYCIESVRRGREGYIINAFINVMTVIGAISLFFWIFGTMLEVIPPTATMQYIRGNIYLQTKSYYHIYFSNEVQKFVLFGLNLVRNVGIFAEAPSYASPLLYAIGAELFYKRENANYMKVAILTVATITTLSSKGFVGVILVFIIRYLFFTKARNRVHTVVLILLSFVVVVIGVYLISVILIEKSYSATGIDRIQDLRAAMRAFFSSPVFGVGFNNFEKVHNLGSSSLKGMSMGIATLMAYGGIYLLIPFLWPVLALLFGKMRTSYRKEMLCFSIIVIFDFFVSTMYSNPCLFAVVGFAYGVIMKKRSVEVNEVYSTNG